MALNGKTNQNILPKRPRNRVIYLIVHSAPNRGGWGWEGGLLRYRYGGVEMETYNLLHQYSSSRYNYPARCVTQILRGAGDTDGYYRSNIVT